MSPRARPQELVTDPDHCCCAFGNVVLIYSLRVPTNSHVERTVGAIAELGRRYPAGLGLLLLLDPSAGAPDEPARRAIRQFYFDIATFVRAGVQVIEGEGFVAAGKRSVVTLINMGTKLPFPLKVVGSLEQGSSLLLELLGRKTDSSLQPHTLCGAVEARRAEFMGKRSP